MTDPRSTTPAVDTVDRSEPPGPGPRRPFNFPPIERFSLSNGLPVLMARTEGPPVATIGLILPAAGVHEAPERAGLASLTGSLLESGTERKAGTLIAEELEGLGAQFGVVTGWDVTEVEMTLLTSRLEPGAELFAEIARRPAFPEDEVERVRKEQLAGILQRRAEPRGLANEAASRFIYAEDSPFARPLSGTTGTLESLARADVAAFHAGRYTPNGATAIVAGPLDPEDAQALLSAALADWVGPAPTGVPPGAEAAARERRVVIVDRPGSVQSELRVGHVGVPRSNPDYFPLIVMNTILGGAFTSRLNMNLREKQGFTYGVSSGFSMRRQAGPFVISTAVQTEVTAAAVTEILREVESIREAPVGSGELEDARNYIAGVFPLRLETTDGVASRLAEMAVHDLPADYFDGYRERVLAVRTEEVHRVARQYIRPDELCVVVVGDAKSIRAPLEELGIGTVEVVAVGDLP